MRKTVIVFLVILFFSLRPKVYAHPGRTASDGCHYCRTNCAYWGEVYGARHCHGGSSADPNPIIFPTSTPILPVVPPVYPPTSTPTPWPTLKPWPTYPPSPTLKPKLMITPMATSTIKPSPTATLTPVPTPEVLGGTAPTQKIDVQINIFQRFWNSILSLFRKN